MKCENCLHCEACKSMVSVIERATMYSIAMRVCNNYADKDLYIKRNNTSEIHKAAIEYYSAEMQENQCIEECAELIQAINKKHRGRAHNIPEEIADVEICLEQLKIINNCADEVENYKTAKMERLKARITK